MSDLLDAMRAHGLNPPAEMRPGKYLRFSSNGKPGDKSGWIFIFPDEQGAVFGDHRTGLKETWQAKRDQPMNEAERTAWRKQCDDAHAEAEKQRKMDYAAAAAKAQQDLDACTPANPEHGYFAKKKIHPHGALQDAQGNLVIPVVSINGDVQSLQKISAAGRKSFAKGGQMKGGMHWIREPGDMIFLGEGFATMASIAESIPTGGVACCFSAGNMLTTAKAIRGKYPRAEIILCGDNDASGVGQKAATDAAKAVGGRVALPDTQGDWNDVYAHDGAGAVKRGVTVTKTAKKTRPVLQLDNGKWPELIQTVIKKLSDDHVVFDLGGALTTIDGEGNTFPVTAPWLSTAIEHLFTVMKFDARTAAYVPAKVPIEFGQRLLAAREMWQFPKLNGVTRHRVMRSDGSVLDKPGYDLRTGLYLHQRGDWAPIPEDLQTAIETLWYPVSRMPFVSPADSGAALALLLTAVQRPILDLAPMFLTSAPDFSSGKTLIAEVASHLAGGDGGVSSFTNDDEEMQKRIISALTAGDPCIIMDNASGQITGDSLARALTATTFKGRILGTNTQVALPTRTLWTATGVNISPSADMVRRVITIRVDPKCERPDLRKFDFHPVEWARKHLPEMQAAAMRILKESPAHGDSPLGSFTAWDAQIRAAVLHIIKSGLAPCEMADPADTVTREKAEDPEVEQLGAILHAWSAMFGERLIPLTDVGAIVKSGV